MMKYACPCCGNYTYSQPIGGTYDICPVCFWEDDGFQLNHPDYGGGANTPSLNQARVNYKKFGACEERVLEYVRKPKKNELPQNNNK